jgi:hypothetical protein
VLTAAPPSAASGAADFFPWRERERELAVVSDLGGGIRRQTRLDCWPTQFVAHRIESGPVMVVIELRPSFSAAKNGCTTEIPEAAAKENSDRLMTSQSCSTKTPFGIAFVLFRREYLHGTIVVMFTVVDWMINQGNLILVKKGIYLHAPTDVMYTFIDWMIKIRAISFCKTNTSLYVHTLQMNPSLSVFFSFSYLK